jgi:hypothetical protein
MSVSVDAGATPHFSLPHELFKSPSKTRQNTRNQYAVATDGQKFLFVSTEGKEIPGTTKVVLNWPALLARK